MKSKQMSLLKRQLQSKIRRQMAQAVVYVLENGPSRLRKDYQIILPYLKKITICKTFENKLGLF